MGLGSFFSNLGSNIASGAKKTKEFVKNQASGIAGSVSSGAKTAWKGIKEHGPEVLGTALKGVEHLAPHLGPLGTAVSAASKALSPHLAKAIGGNFEKGYNLSRFTGSGGGSTNSSGSSSSSGISSKIAQGITPGVKQAIPTRGMDPNYRSKVTFR